MNRRERRKGRAMYLLPLMLALTGMALLPLEWVLRINDFNSFQDLRQTMVHTLPILIYPVILLGLYVFRVPPKAARVFSLVSLAVTLLHLLVIFLCANRAATGLLVWIPGHTLLASLAALRSAVTAQSVLLFCSDAAMLLCNVCAIPGCLRYAAVKKKSDLRNAEFDRQAQAAGLYVPKTSRSQKQQQEEWQSDWQQSDAEPEAPFVSEEPTRVLPSQPVGSVPAEDQALLSAIDQLIE